MSGSKKEILVTGFGGQGIVLLGKILGAAAALGDHKESTLIQAYGPESRGGACSAQVMIGDGVIHYPYVRRPDVLAAMSQAGFEKYIDLAKDDTVLLVDQDLVKPKGQAQEVFAVPATRLAEEMGKKMMANIIMLGFIVAVSRVVTNEAARSAVTSSVPKGTEDANLAAYDKGHDFGLAVLKGREKKLAAQG